MYSGLIKTIYGHSLIYSLTSLIIAFASSIKSAFNSPLLVVNPLFALMVLSSLSRISSVGITTNL